MSNMIGINNKKAMMWSEIVKWGLALLLLVFLLFLALYSRGAVGDIMRRISIL